MFSRRVPKSSEILAPEHHWVILQMGIYLLALVAKRVLEGELYTLSSKDLLAKCFERAGIQLKL